MADEKVKVRIGADLRGFQSDMNKAGDMVGKAAKRMTIAFAGVVTASALIGAKFQQTLTETATVAQAFGSDLKALEDKARDLGRTTAFTATQAAAGMYDLASAGLNTKQIIDSTEHAMKLAGATGSEMTQATGLLAASMKQFGLDADQSRRITDTYAAAITGSQLTMERLTEAMKYAGTTGASLGWTIEETTAAVAQFANLGMEGSMAGTNLRMAMISLTKGTDEAKEALQGMGLTLADVSPETHTFGEIIKTLGEKAITSEQAIKIFGARSALNMKMLSEQAAQGKIDFEGFTQSLIDAQAGVGRTSQMYDRMMDTFQGKWKIMVSALQELNITFFDTFEKEGKEVFEYITVKINKMIDFIKKNEDSFSAFFDVIISGGKQTYGHLEAITDSVSQILTLIGEESGLLSFIKKYPFILEYGIIGGLLLGGGPSGAAVAIMLGVVIDYIGTLAKGMGLVEANQIKMADFMRLSMEDKKKFLDLWKAENTTIANQVVLLNNLNKELEHNTYQLKIGALSNDVREAYENRNKAIKEEIDLIHKVTIAKTKQAAFDKQMAEDEAKDSKMSYEAYHRMIKQKVQWATKEKQIQAERARQLKWEKGYLKEIAKDVQVDYLEYDKIMKQKVLAIIKETEAQRKFHIELESLRGNDLTAFKMSLEDQKKGWRELKISESDITERANILLKQKIAEITKAEKDKNEVVLKDLKESKAKELKEHGTFVDGVKAGIDELIEKQKSWGIIGLELMTKFGEEAKTALSSTLFSVIKGEFDNIGDAWNSMLNSMLRALTDMIAQALTKWAVSGLLDIFGAATGTTISGTRTGSGSSGLGIKDALDIFSGLKKLKDIQAAGGISSWLLGEAPASGLAGLGGAGEVGTAGSAGALGGWGSMPAGALAAGIFAAAAIVAFLVAKNQRGARYAEISPGNVQFDPTGGYEITGFKDVSSRGEGFYPGTDYDKIAKNFQKVLKDSATLMLDQYEDVFERLRNVAFLGGFPGLDEAISDFGGTLSAVFNSGFEGFSIAISSGNIEEQMATFIKHMADQLSDEATRFANKLGYEANEKLGISAFEALMLALAKFEAALALSAQTVGNAFRAGLETGEFANFEQTLYNSIHDQILDALMSSLITSRVFETALAPLYIGIDDALATAFDEDGSFNAETFMAAIAPLLAGAQVTIEAMRPMFEAIGLTMEQIDAILGVTKDTIAATEDLIEKASSSTIGKAFRDGLNTGEFKDFEKSLYNTIYDNVLDALINAFIQSEVFKKALAPFYKGLDDAINLSFNEDGSFNANTFRDAIGPLLEGAKATVAALEPMFTAFSDVAKNFRDILGIEDTTPPPPPTSHTGGRVMQTGITLVKSGEDIVSADVVTILEDLTRQINAASGVGGGSGRPINIQVYVANEEFETYIENVSDNIRVKAGKAGIPATERIYSH